MVEPVFGVLGAVAVKLAEPALPYALAFAAGAMIYVVADDIIPEANTRYFILISKLFNSSSAFSFLHFFFRPKANKFTNIVTFFSQTKLWKE